MFLGKYALTMLFIGVLLDDDDEQSSSDACGSSAPGDMEHG